MVGKRVDVRESHPAHIRADELGEDAGRTQLDICAKGNGGA